MKLTVDYLVKHCGWRLGVESARYGSGLLMVLTPYGLNPVDMADDYGCGGDEDWNLFDKICLQLEWFPAVNVDSVAEGMDRINAILTVVEAKLQQMNDVSIDDWSSAVYWVWFYAAKAWDEHVHVVDVIADRLTKAGEWNLEPFITGDINIFE